jgi:release factor glutamine methyltransferase
VPTDARHILNAAADILATAGVENPRGDARLLLGLAMGRDGPVLPHEDLDNYNEAIATSFDDLIARRVGGEPVSRMRGWREFWSLRFAINEATLDPRPDSECLVEAAIAFGRLRDTGDPAKPLKIADLGTGSGCLLLACLSELPVAIGVGIDINGSAIAMARANATALGLDDRARFIERSFTVLAKDKGPDTDPDTDLDTGITAQDFDIILCNPPYIPSAEIAGLADEVALYDPHLALDGGDDGLSAWRALMPNIAALLTIGGRAFVEIGDGQEDDVDLIAAAAGLYPDGRVLDLSGTIRTLIYRPAGPLDGSEEHAADLE